jgi:transposase
VAGRPVSRLRVRRPLLREVQRLARTTKAPHAWVERARIIERAEVGMSSYAIGRELRVDEATVRKWRGRFKKRPKLTTLRDAARSGRPATFSSEQRAEVVRLACERPKDNKTKFRNVWTFSSLRDAVESKLGLRLSRTEVWRILQLRGVRPHRVSGWLHSSDPLFREKVAAICKVYVEPPPGATVLSFDEKPGMGAREHAHPMKLASRRGPGRKEFEYVRHGTVCLLAAFNVQTGEVFGRCLPRTAENEVAFFEELALRHPTGPVYVIWDNLNVHTGKRWEDFNGRHGGRFHFLYTPKHASWVNQIECWFSILQRRVIRHGSFRSREALMRGVRGFIAHWNDVEAHPFRWRFRGEFREVVLPALAA